MHYIDVLLLLVCAGGLVHRLNEVRPCPCTCDKNTTVTSYPAEDNTLKGTPSQIRVDDSDNTRIGGQLFGVLHPIQFDVPQDIPPASPSPFVFFFAPTPSVTRHWLETQYGGDIRTPMMSGYIDVEPTRYCANVTVSPSFSWGDVVAMVSLVSFDAELRPITRRRLDYGVRCVEDDSLLFDDTQRHYYILVTNWRDTPLVGKLI